MTHIDPFLIEQVKKDIKTIREPLWNTALNLLHGYAMYAYLDAVEGEPQAKELFDTLYQLALDVEKVANDLGALSWFLRKPDFKTFCSDMRKSNAKSIAYRKRTLAYFKKVAKQDQKERQKFPNRVTTQTEPIQYENETIVITDPCYLNSGNKPKKIHDPYSPKNTDNFQAKLPYIYASTLYGDWSCHTLLNTEEFQQLDAEMDQYRSDWKYPLIKRMNRRVVKALKNKLDKFVLGQFCADSSKVIVCAMTDVLAFNPKAKKTLFTPDQAWRVTVIEKFTGTVTYNVVDTATCYIEGVGNVPFITRQTGL
jgi:hypothetical protein